MNYKIVSDISDYESRMLVKLYILADFSKRGLKYPPENKEFSIHTYIDQHIYRLASEILKHSKSEYVADLVINTLISITKSSKVKGQPLFILGALAEIYPSIREKTVTYLVELYNFNFLALDLNTMERAVGHRLRVLKKLVGLVRENRELKKMYADAQSVFDERYRSETEKKLKFVQKMLDFKLNVEDLISQHEN